MNEIFSEDRRYRYALERDLLEPLLQPLVAVTCVFIGLNPSTADEKKDDPTIRRCKAFARAWGASRLRMLNLYAYRSTDPDALRTAVNPVGPDNDWHLLEGTRDAGIIICAWGTNAELQREREVVEMLQHAGRTLRVLRWTKVSKKPEHPLYVGGSTSPTPWVPETDR